MEFRAYLHGLSDRLGEAQLPVNGAWRRADQIVRTDAVHYALVKKIMADLYKCNHCSNPSDPVHIDTVLDYLGQLQFELKARPEHDLEAIGLVERIGEISVTLLIGEDAEPRRATARKAADGTPRSESI